MHLVHRRNDFPTATAAVISDEPNALAVLGFFFKVHYCFTLHYYYIIGCMVYH